MTESIDEYQTAGGAVRLKTYILGNMEKILAEWVGFARKIQPPEGSMDILELRDHAEEMLRTIAADLETPQTDAERRIKSEGEKPRGIKDTPAETHATGRLHSGFPIDSLVAEYRALRSSVLNLWLKQGKIEGDDQVTDLLRFNEAIDQALAESIARYSATMTQGQDIFLGILGHDLRSPLQSLSLGAQFLISSQQADSGLVQLGSRMFSSVSRMKGMLDNLLDFTQSRLGDRIEISPVRCDLSKVSEEVADEFRLSNPNTGLENTSHGDCRGTWDPLRVSQVYQNLISNAIQYGTRDSTIRIHTEGEDDEVTFTVHNEGPVIPEKDQKRMFDLMQRVISHADSPDHSVKKNLGLGLYIAREIVKAHQGSISVSSDEKEGTRFTVRLPRRMQGQAYGHSPDPD
jgi:signal transduction histidine kinase